MQVLANLFFFPQSSQLRHTVSHLQVEDSIKMCRKPKSDFGKAQKMSKTFYGAPKVTWLVLLR